MRLALLVALVLAGCAQPVAAGLPDSIAVLGDSISRAMNARGEQFQEWPLHVWATGNDPADGIESHYERLRALDPALDVVAFNDARSGARMDALAEQAGEAVRQRAQYVVLLLGANDVCARTEPAVFAAQLDAGADVLSRADATVLVASVPDVARLAELYRGNETARAVWAAFRVCPGVLGADADLEDVRARTRAFNDALRDEAAARGWRWDGGAVFDAAYAEGDVSTVDFFHPSLAGQARLADATWRAGPYAT